MCVSRTPSCALARRSRSSTVLQRTPSSHAAFAMVRFYPAEVAFLREQWATPTIQDIVHRPEKNGRIQDISNELCKLFEKNCTTPYPGETDGEFKKRRGNMKAEQKAGATKKPAETQEEFAARVANLAKVCDLRDMRSLYCC